MKAFTLNAVGTISTLVMVILLLACSNNGANLERQNNQNSADTAWFSEKYIDSILMAFDTVDPDIDFVEIDEEVLDSTETIFVELLPGDFDPTFFSDDSLIMESTYLNILKPITSLKMSDPKTYWFIVSWLNTAYKTPNWNGYEEYKTWKSNALKTGVDCSGFTRVMCDRIFNKTVGGSSQGILNNQCVPIARAELTKGDLVFFRAPYSESDRIVHVGVYLMDGYFVHATSTKSASKGRGLMVNSLNEKNWAAEFVTAGRIKEE